MRPRRGARGRIWGRDVGIGQPVFEAGPDGARLFQRLRAAEAARDRRRRRGAAVRARARAAAQRGSSRSRRSEITPQFLDRMIRALKRWKYDIVSIDEVCRRAVTLPAARRFVCLTFDGGYKDVIDVGLSRAVQARRSLHSLSSDRVSRRARRGVVAGAGRNDRARKPHQPGDRPQGAAFHHPAARRRNIELTNFWRAGCARCRRRICHSRSTISASAIRSTSRRCRAASSMDWDDLTKLAADPNVTIGSATVNYPVLSSLKDADAQREIAMGKAVAEAAFHRDDQAFRLSVRRPRRVSPAACGDGGGGGSSPARPPRCRAWSRPKGYTNLHALPRVAWDGRQRSLRMMRVMLSGAFFARGEGERSELGTELDVRRRAATSS